MKDDSGWRPIETAPRSIVPIWLAKLGSMRLGFWKSGAEYENHGSVGGGWIDHALSETNGPCGLKFAPTHWMPLPPELL